MGDLTKAGSNRGDLERELEDTLLCAKITYQRYLLTIEDYTKEELKEDLEKYILQLDNFPFPCSWKGFAKRPFPSEATVGGRGVEQGKE